MRAENLSTPQQKILASICRRLTVRALYSFGTRDCDIERFLVEINEPDPIKRGEFLIEFWDELETLFHNRVDLLTPTSIRNPYVKKIVEKSKVLLYER